MGCAAEICKDREAGKASMSDQERSATSQCPKKEGSGQDWTHGSMVKALAASSPQPLKEAARRRARLGRQQQQTSSARMKSGTRIEGRMILSKRSARSAPAGWPGETASVGIGEAMVKDEVEAE